MARLLLEVDEDQEFAESILFSMAIADQFRHLDREYCRSFSDIVETCLRRHGQIRRRYIARGIGWLRRQSVILVSWTFCLEEAVAALEHVESELDQRELRILNAGRALLADLPVGLLRWQFDEPFDCSVCQNFPMTHSSGVPLPSQDQLAAIVGDPAQARLLVRCSEAQ